MTEMSQVEPLSAFDCADHLSEKQFRSLPLIRGVTAFILLLILFVPTIIFLVYCCINCCIKKYCPQRVHPFQSRLDKLFLYLFHNRLDRLFLYLTISNILYLISLTMQVEHYINYLDQEKELCVAIGFLDQQTGSAQLLFTLAITWYMMNLIYKTYKGNKISKGKDMGKDKDKSTKERIQNEVLFFIFLWFLPLIITWIPFVAVPYGEAGPWCWIQHWINCTFTSRAYAEEISLWYIPYGFVAFNSFIGFVVVLVATCKLQLTPDKKVLHCIFLLFLSASLVLCTLEIAIHAATFKTNTSLYPSYVVYALTAPISSASIPIAFLVICIHHVIRWFCCHNKRKEYVDLDNEANKQNGDDIEATTYKSSELSNQPSHTTVWFNVNASDYSFPSENGVI